MILLLLACKPEPGPIGPLHAAVAVVDITPQGFESWLDCGEDGLCEGDDGWPGADEGESDATYDSGELFLDCGLDRLCEGDEGWPGADEGEGDGEFQALHLAGLQGSYGSTYGGRPAQGVHDPITARLLYMRQGDEEVLFVLFDVVGLFHKYTHALRREISAASDIPSDRIIVAALHDHEAPDSMGLWSPSGVSQDFMQPALDATIEAALSLPGDSVPVTATWAVGAPPACLDPSGELRDLEDCEEPASEDEAREDDWTPVMLTDTRDPYVRALEVVALRLDDDDGSTVATLVDWTNHVETLGDENALISADFPHYVRERIEDEYGGVALYASGPLGGMMTPLRSTPVPLWDEAGTGRMEDEGSTLLVQSSGYEKAWSTGYEVAQAAIDALASAEPETGELKVQCKRLSIPMRPEFQLLFTLTEYYDPSDDATTDEGEDCWDGCVEVDLWSVELGGLVLATVPGEAFPELLVGRPAVTVDYSAEGWPAYDFPAVRGIREATSNEAVFLVGLADNELGYLVPEPDFLDEDNPLVPGDPEDHPNYYEESVSGHETAGVAVCDALIDLLGGTGTCLEP